MYVYLASTRHYTRSVHNANYAMLPSFARSQYLQFITVYINTTPRITLRTDVNLNIIIKTDV